MMRRFTYLLAVVVLSLPPGSRASAQGRRFDLEKTRTVLTGLIQQTLADRGIPSMSIALVRGDSIVWKAAFGYANMRTRTPATTETLYSTGSSGKSVTAAAIMQLVEQGKIKLDDPINRYLGDSRVRDQLQVEKPVTFRHILSHWSGLRAGAETQPIWGRKLPKTLEELTSALYSVRAPETRWEYNNFAYGAAGLLVQKVSETEYEKYLVERILEPLGMTTPHPVYPSPDMVERMALPYAAGGSLGKPEPVAQVHFDVYPAGDLYMTAEDMARFLGAQINKGIFQGKRILSEESVLTMHKPYFGGTYGFGFWMIRDSISGDTLVHHGGAIAGQRAFMIGDVDAKVGVYYMTNSDYLPDSPPMRSEIVDAALKLLRGEEYVPPPPRRGIAVDDKVLNSYVGTYEVGSTTLTVSRVGKALALRQGSQPAINELLAETPTRFFQKGSNATFTFEGDGERLVIDAGGQKRTATRRK